MIGVMADGLLPIGAFSRASFLSIKSLRAYHEAGILVPARVDPATGYRTYHASQLIDAAVIARLRSLDLPLDRVREVVQARDPEVTARVLADHESTMKQRLADVERIVAELHDGLAQPAAHTPVHVRDEPHVHTLAVRGRVNEENFAQFLDEAYRRLNLAAERLGVAAIGPSGALYPPEISDDGDDDVEAYVPLARPVALSVSGDGVVNSEVSAARVAVLVHAGGYDTIADTYRSLGAWVAEHADPLPVPVREIYVVSYGETDDTSRFRTEIHWPINDRSNVP
jgi:DNA-binding transcriptional MerR regulator